MAKVLKEKFVYSNLTWVSAMIDRLNALFWQRILRSRLIRRYFLHHLDEYDANIAVSGYKLVNVLNLANCLEFISMNILSGTITSSTRYQDATPLYQYYENWNISPNMSLERN